MSKKKLLPEKATKENTRDQGSSVDTPARKGQHRRDEEEEDESLAAQNSGRGAADFEG